MASYKKKLIVSGNYIELLEFEKPVYYNLKSKTRTVSTGRSQVAGDENKQINRATTIRRAKKEIKRYIYCNSFKYRSYDEKVLLPSLVTLTYEKNMTDIKQSRLDFDKFIERMNYHVNKDKRRALKYVSVLELQNRGAIHYHTVFFNLPFIPKEEFAKKWTHGMSNIATKTDLEPLSYYMIKDMRPEHMIGNKSYLNSKYLLQPKVIHDEEEIKKYLARNNVELFYRGTTNPAKGEVTYSGYLMKRTK